MTRKANRKATNAVIGTQTELAKQLDCHVSQVNRYLRDERWPFARQSPWKSSEVPAMKRWRAETLTREAEGIDDDDADELVVLRKQKLKQEIRKLTAGADCEEMERDELNGKLVVKEDYRRQWLTQMQTIKSKFRGVGANLAAQLVGLDAGEIQTRIDDEVEQYFRELSE